MIQTGETSDVAAEVLVFLPDQTNPTQGITGYVFTLGEAKIKPPGAGAFTNVALDHIIERGFGWYALRATAAQRAVAGELAYDVTPLTLAQPDRGSEIIGTVGGEIAQGSAGFIPFYLPNEIDPVYGPPVTGHVFVLGEVKLSLPGGAFTNVPLTSIVELGGGIYGVVLSPTDTANRGKAIVYADVPGAQLASGYRSIVNPAAVAAAAYPYISTPPAGPFIFPIAAGVEDACDPTFFTEEDLLAVIDRVFPEWYLMPLKNPGPGWELFQSYAKVFERVSLAVGRSQCSAYVTHASGGKHSQGIVEFYRSSLISGIFTIKKGTIVKTSKTNRSYRVTRDYAFGATDLTILATVEAVGYGPEYDVPGPVITADGTLLPGEIDTLTLPILEPVFAEPTLQVRQVLDTTGGQAAVLDQHGLDRGLPRLHNETDSNYKGRIRAMPDTVSPDALRRQLDAIFLPMGLSYELIETWQNEYQSCWDAPLGTITHPEMGTLAEDTFAFDDPRTNVFRGRWMDDRDCPAGLVVVVPALTSMLMRGMAYDDAVTTEVGYETVLGLRASCTYDEPDQDVDGSLLLGFYDADDLGQNNFYLHVNNVLNQIKGGGTSSALELKGQ